MSPSHPKPAARFELSLHPEIFFALQLLSDPSEASSCRWRERALDAFPLERWPIQLPSVLWTAVPDVLELEPTSEIEGIVGALEQIPERSLQLRLLTGLLHHESAAKALLDEGQPLERIAASLPRAKREWLAHVGLYPLEPDVEAALDALLERPASFAAGLAATVRLFWDVVFRQTWNELRPAYELSIEQKRSLYERCSLADFLRHTLLPIELMESRGVLRALRGGYELPLSQIRECVLIPSAFNRSRFWTTHGPKDQQRPWLPYFEPSLDPTLDDAGTPGRGPAPDVALIFRALGNATRFAMISLIGRCPLSAAELASQLAVSKPTISHHLHLLRAAGLVHETDHKDSNLISLNKGILYQLSDLTVSRLLESREPVELTRSRRS